MLQTLLLAAAFVAAALYCIHELNRAVANPDASAFALLTRVRLDDAVWSTVGRSIGRLTESHTYTFT